MLVTVIGECWVLGGDDNNDDSNEMMWYASCSKQNDKGMIQESEWPVYVRMHASEWDGKGLCLMSGGGGVGGIQDSIQGINDLKGKEKWEKHTHGTKERQVVGVGK